MALRRFFIVGFTVSFFLFSSGGASEKTPPQSELQELLESLEQKKRNSSAAFEQSNETNRLLRKENEALKRTVHNLESSNIAFARQIGILFSQLEMLSAKESIMKEEMDSLVLQWKKADQKRIELAEEYESLANRSARNEEMLAEYPRAMERLKQIEGTLENQMRMTAEFEDHLLKLSANLNRQKHRQEPVTLSAPPALR